MSETMGDLPDLGQVRERPTWIRTGSVFIRAVHLLGASAVAGGSLLSVRDVDVLHWWILVAASGVLLLGAEFYRHRTLHREVAGWATILKLVLLGMIPLLPGAAFWLVSAAFLAAVVGAHAPKSWRHRRLF